MSAYDVLELLTSFLDSYSMQLFVAGLLFGIHMPRKKYFWLKFLILFGIMVFLQLAFDLDLYPMDLLGGINLLAIFAVDLLILFLCFGFDWKQTLFIGTVSWTLQHFQSRIFQLLDETVLAGIPADVGREVILDCIHIALSAILFFGFYRIFICQILRSGGFENFSNMHDLYIIILSAVTISVVYILSMLVTREEGKDIYHLLYAACCCLLLLFLQFGVFVRGVDKHRADVIKEMLAFEHEQRQLSKTNMEIFNSKCHDLRHQINDIRKIVNNELLEQRLDELEETVRVYDSFIRTGNSTLDILLTEKKLYCDKYGIRFTCIADGRRLGFVSEEDLYSLLGNALDNSIESVSDAGEEDRFISMSLTAKGELIILHVENYCRDGDKIVFVDGLPQTTKKDSLYHGLGMLGMRYITEKYGGTMAVSARSDRFSLDIVLPVPVGTAAE